MIKVLFIGGFQHKQIRKLAGCNIWDLNNTFRWPVLPDEEDLLCVQSVTNPKKMDAHEEEVYVLQKIWIRKGNRRLESLAYVLQGITKEAVDVYLAEPGMQERVLKVAI